MIFFGHRFIKNIRFYHVLSQEAILKTPPSSVLYTEFSENSLELINYIYLNNMPLALYVKNITEALYASSFNAKYIVVKKEIANEVQKVANEYLLDAKILAFIEDEEDIKELAQDGVDGVIFGEAIVKTVA